MHCNLRVVLAASLLLSAAHLPLGAQQPSSGRIYHVACNEAAGSNMSRDAQTAQADDRDAHSLILRSIDEVNAVLLQPGDSLLFLRGTVCHGSLHPQGNGFTIDADGSGALPRIEAGPTDEAALRLFNQENICIASLDLTGGTTYGVEITGDHGTMHSISLHNLTVSNVRGTLKRKESGLVVIHPAAPEATFEDVHLDGIRAFNTTQWAGILIAGGGSIDHPASSVTVSNSIVHDVQGDGIVIFNGKDGVIEHSVAWHTGMQHQQNIGTPNAIWTWECNRCVVKDNEAFLADSPGVDGGAFDIDWGSTLNTVERNFGHDTQGYCISVFGANGPTKDSIVKNNLCLNNGRSPRLAQRQGAILLMTWAGGSIEGLDLIGNRIDWAPDGDIPAIQTGRALKAVKINIANNEIHTTTTALIDRSVKLSVTGNRYFLEGAMQADLTAVRKNLLQAQETGSIVALESAKDSLTGSAAHADGWQLIATVPAQALKDSNALAEIFINLSVAALQFSHAGLRVSLAGDEKLLQSARDGLLPGDGVQLSKLPQSPHPAFSLKLVAPDGLAAQAWTGPVSPIDLGVALRKVLGPPDYGRLAMLQVSATD